MKFEVSGVRKGDELDEFRSNWTKFTSEENKVIINDGRVSKAQLLMIHLFCGYDNPYGDKADVVVSTHGPAQAELEALFRARGRALAMLLQTEMHQPE